ncbi:hypothetical protein F3K43_47095 [Streptomyces sp. LBUM 1476]|nr:hypothetical protein [Streptomyces sp. LBUM 1476]
MTVRCRRCAQVPPGGAIVAEPTLPNLSHLEEIFSEKGDGVVGPVQSRDWQSSVSPQDSR